VSIPLPEIKGRSGGCLGIRKKLKEKLKEALQAVLPIIGLVLLLSFTIAPISPSILLCFLIGGILLIAGIVFFTLGAELAMSPMGERVGTAMTQSKKLWVVVALSFLLGFIITISEPDLQVLAQQVPAVPNLTLILAVACGVGVFLVVALLRMLFSIALPPFLVCFYAVIFILAFFVPKEFLSVAFDSGGVTTGPMTVPFIMALGVGISATRSDRHAADDSFGLVALCSIGPILAVMMLGMIYNPDSAAYTPPVIPEIADSKQLWNLFAVELPTYMKEIALSLLPIVLFFAVFQALILKLSGRNLTRILIGLVYTYIGLVLFLTGVNVGFMPAGNYLGQVLAGLSHPWVIVPIAMVMGYFIVKAEPAVYVLNKQVEEITDGAIPARAMGTALSAGVAISLGIAMIRVLTGISILWILIPGYTIALVISFFVPKIYTAIAFDSGGVASGPMTAAFLLPLAQGACVALGGNIVTDAFGVVAMVAMTPLITIQVMGLYSKLAEKKKTAAVPTPAYAFDLLDDDAIIEL
jgi:putative membrane protein